MCTKQMYINIHKEIKIVVAMIEEKEEAKVEGGLKGYELDALWKEAEVKRDLPDLPG